MQIMKELKRVLKKTGTLFWNVSDTYSGAGAGWKETGTNKSGKLLLFEKVIK